jgi:hypothetical protein
MMNYLRDVICSTFWILFVFSIYFDMSFIYMFAIVKYTSPRVAMYFKSHVWKIGDVFYIIKILRNFSDDTKTEKSDI